MGLEQGREEMLVETYSPNERRLDDTSLAHERTPALSMSD